MELLRGHFSAALLLHIITVAAPLATLFVAAGVASWKTSVRLLLLGLAATAATAKLTSIDASSSFARIELGAPLPFARAPWDVEAGQRVGEYAVLGVNLVGDAIFWCSALLVVGTILRGLVLRLAASLRREREVRRRRARRTPVRSVAFREVAARHEFPGLPARI